MYGYDSYKINDIETATQVKLIVMLYAGAIKFSHLAIEAIEKNDIESASTNIIKTQNIISELLSSLNFEAGTIADDLSGLYIYIHRLLVEGNIQKNIAPIQESISLLTNLKEAWDDLLAKENSANKNTANINISG
ncbi:MAG: flagellar export chaperone FliS [Brevinema sp.]